MIFFLLPLLSLLTFEFLCTSLLYMKMTKQKFGSYYGTMLFPSYVRSLFLFLSFGSLRPISLEALSISFLWSTHLRRVPKRKCSLIGQDNSFELVLHVNHEKQGSLFSEILSMKNKDETISEISINMESLENILTTC